MNSAVISTVLTAAGLPQYPNPYSLSSLQQIHHADRPYERDVKADRPPSFLARALASLIGKARHKLGQKSTAVALPQSDVCLANCQG